MKITCPYCKKNFNVDTSLIPSEGRLLKCGSCNQEWFYKQSEPAENYSKISKNNPPDEISLNESQIKASSLVENEQEIQIPKETEAIISQAEIKIKKNIVNKDNIEAKNLSETKNNGISNFFSYLIVFIISFIALIILLDTFKTPLINVFPGIENILFSLFEILKDIRLFIIDLT